MKIFNNETENSYVLKLNTTENYNDINQIFKYIDTIYHYVSPVYGLLIKICINKYEHLTFENLNNYAKNILSRNNKLINNKQLFFENNIITLLKYNMFPLLKNFKENSLLKNSNNNGIYYNLINNKYINKLKNKNILIIKLVGPYEITRDILLLKFSREVYLKKKNNVKTIFLFHNYNYEISAYNISTYNLKYDYKIFNINEINSIEFNNYIKDTDILYLTSINYFRPRDCLKDQTIFLNNLNILNCVLKNLNLNGDIILEDIFPKIQPHIELFYILHTSFKKLEFYKMRFTYKKDGFFIFKKLIKNISLDKIVNEYLNIDPFFGSKLNIKLENTDCDSRIKTTVYNTKSMISSILNTEVPKKFIDYMTNLYNISIKQSKKLDSRTTYVLDKLNLNKINSYSLIPKNVIYNLNTEIITKIEIDEDKIYEILLENLDFCLKKCLKQNLEISDYYKLQSVPKNDKIIIQMFDKKLFNIKELNSLNLTLNNTLSIMNSKSLIKFMKTITTEFKNIKNIIDINPNFGLFTFYFSKFFEDVICINNNEIALTYNINLFDFKNISLIQIDIYNLYIKNYLNNKNYCIFIDVPTNEFESINNITDYTLYINNTNIIEYCEKISLSNICLKVPMQYNFLKIKPYFENIKEIIIDKQYKFIFIKKII